MVTAAAVVSVSPTGSGTAFQQTTAATQSVFSAVQGGALGAALRQLGVAAVAGAQLEDPPVALFSFSPPPNPPPPPSPRPPTVPAACVPAPHRSKTQ